jgi:prepilin-type N-terminal cleavage/methylation domain-containing protein/prepilin-type processing-associated H-X9-DG protein
MNKKKLNYGFTLIELLVVIAILAILMAILLPALQGARERGRTAKCLSNIKQMGIALKMYNNQYEDFYPDYDLPGDNNTSGWFRHLDKYIDNRLMFECPSAKLQEFTKFGIAYGYNYPGLGDWYANPPIKIKEGMVKEPSFTIAIADSDEDQWWDSVIKAREWPPYDMYHVSKRHLKGANICFADGSGRRYDHDYIMAMPWNNPPFYTGATRPTKESWWDIW